MSLSLASCIQTYIWSYCRDRCRTTSNVLDDCFATAVITKFTEKELDIVDTKATEAESEKMLQNVDSVV